MFGKKKKKDKLKIKKKPTLWDTMGDDIMKNKTKKKNLSKLEQAMKEAGML
tara:strand:+ start:572 stop:724 length:153 start_codon:yes stop_codon:yes gene_type:complete